MGWHFSKRAQSDCGAIHTSEPEERQQAIHKKTLNPRGRTVLAVIVTSVVVSMINPTTAVPVQRAQIVFMDRPVHVMAKELFDAKSYQCWKYITAHESHFNPKAVNASSGAKGIGQLLPSTMRSLGLNKNNDSANVQLIGQIAYISRHFGSVCGAAKYWKKHSNY